MRHALRRGLSYSNFPLIALNIYSDQYIKGDIMAEKKKAEQEPLRGAQLLRAAVNHIIEHPESWDQARWHCGTSHCLFGQCQIMAGFPQTSNGIREQVQYALGISQSEAAWLSAPNRLLPEIYGFAKKMLDPKFDSDGFDSDGFDRAGFDSDGFNRAGFNRAGFNRAGFDSDGFDRAGFNRAGFNRYGFDRAGFNSDGFNRAGFDSDGFNSDGFDRAGKKLPLL
jgi:hypothetical protein